MLLFDGIEFDVKLGVGVKIFNPPVGLCGAEPERGPIVFTLHFIGVGRGTGGFQFTGGFLPF